MTILFNKIFFYANFPSIINYMIVLAGPSASGKTEVAKYLASHFNLTKIITTTTRPMRKGEVDGRDYFFVTIEKFNEMVENDEFVEYTVYNGNQQLQSVVLA